ncbi:regulator of nonsense transcripts UPF3-like isoform X1 [Nicotiana tomentosiformis]|uniref:regulator of nonsense transcripts UPF3-like isoform X1 n=1 Tax=Nicotiana tomentosiformis TaxID=4098 RepID=UPI00051BD049|nr:regulator of nonsense transcripts UPF3-like isoform X1 [Nicotiana tomentosiformis]
MKGPLDRTKVVLRHLPPTISQSMLVEQVLSRFTGRYNWFSFRPGKSRPSPQIFSCSQKHQTYSRAYVDFKRPEDVIEFAEFFDGHVFVNEKGTQFKTIVEYAPSQRAPKRWSKKDGREGTILKDPEYLEFLEFIAKPIENLPSAEIQLERKEAERAGSAKDAPIVTPLMDYIRQKRAAKSGARKSLSNGRPTRRANGTSSGSPSSSAFKQGSEKRRVSTTMYVLRDSSKAGSGKDKRHILVPKRDDQQQAEKSGTSAPGSGADAVEEETGGAADVGKKKILLLKGKEREIPNVSSGSLIQDNAAPIVKNTITSSAPQQNQRREASGKIIRSILLKDARQNQAPSASQQEQHSQDKDKKPPRPPSVQLFQKEINGVNEDKIVGTDLHVVHTEKQERRSRIRDRPDRGVWTPLRRADSLHASDESLSSSTSQSSEVLDSLEGSQGETKNDLPNVRGGEFRPMGSGRNSHSSFDNGTYKRRGMRDDGISVGEGKPLRRGGPSNYGTHEKQVWVQKSSSGT